MGFSLKKLAQPFINPKNFIEDSAKSLKKAVGGSGPSSSSQNEPWAPAQPYLLDALKGAEKAYGNTPTTAYSGPLVVPESQTTLRGRMDMLNQGKQIAGRGNQMVRFGQDTLSGKYLNREDPRLARTADGAYLNRQDPNLVRTASGAYLGPNDGLDRYVDAVLRPQEERFFEQVLPQIGTAAEQSGAYGGDRHKIIQAQAGRDYQRLRDDTASKILMENYARERSLQENAAARLQAGYLTERGFQEGAAGQINQNYMGERQLQQQAPGMIAQGTNLNLLPAQLQITAGQLGEGYNQRHMDAEYQRYQDRMQAPWVGAQNYANIAAALGGMGGQVQTQEQRGRDPLGGAIGGALLGSKIAPGWGTAIGALGGLVLG